MLLPVDRDLASGMAIRLRLPRAWIADEYSFAASHTSTLPSRDGRQALHQQGVMMDNDDLRALIDAEAREAEAAAHEPDDGAPLPTHVTITRGLITVVYSEADQEWVATTSEFPSLSWLEDEPFAALRGLERLVAEVRED